jgi:hypothetical protein
MKIAAHVLGYNVNRFIKPVLANLEPHVDKIYIAHAERPFGYIEKSRQTMKNPTSVEDLRAASGSNKIEIINGDWATEEEMRNACLVKARADGFDWFLTQDADEFYPEDSWKQIKRILHQNKTDDHFTTTWYNFWKSSHYVMVGMNGSIKSINAGFAIRCSSDIKFIDRRLCNNQHVKIIDCPCHHYSYVMSDTEMAEKLATWSHAHQLFSNNWFTYKWQNWNESTRWLNPVFPYECLRAVPFPMQQPDFAEEFALPLKLYQDKKIPKFTDIVGEAFYDASVQVELGNRSIKRIIKSMLPRK